MLKVYLYCPEDDDEVVKSNGSFVKKISMIFKLLTDNCQLFYDEENIRTYALKSGILGVYLDNSVEQLRILLNKRGALSITNLTVAKTDCVYVRWNFDLMPTVRYAKPLLAEISERYFQFPQEQLLLINIDNIIDTCREKVLVFKDAKQLSDMPYPFAKIDFVTDVEDLKLWLHTHNKATFSLLNRTRFKRTNMIQQGKVVFEEIETGNYWYLDNFHKDEYEVFDHQHEHIGVADLEGILDKTKKVNGRQF